MNEQITKALRAVGYPVTELPDGWIIKGEANPVLEALVEQGVKVAGIVTDPPWMDVGTAYPADLHGGAKSAVNRSGRQWSDILTLQMAYEKNFELLRAIGDERGAAAIFCGTISSAVFTRVAYDNWRHIKLCAWEKGAGRIAKPFAYLPEFVLFCHAKHPYEGSDISPAPSPVFRFPRVKPDQRAHPAVKPVELLEYLVRLTTPLGGIVLDCFAGSFSTMRAARNVGRRFICIEADGEFVARAIDKAQKEGTRRTLFA